MVKTSFRLEPIQPKRRIKSQDWITAYEKAQEKTIKLIERDLKATVRTWETVVRFKVRKVKTADGFGLEASTENRIYHFVDAGTRPHRISAKGGGLLRFQTGYVAKTRVGIIGSRQGGAFGDWRSAESVQHPGFPGREFTERIRRRRQTTLEQETRQALARIARKQG